MSLAANFLVTDDLHRRQLLLRAFATGVAAITGALNLLLLLSLIIGGQINILLVTAICGEWLLIALALITRRFAQHEMGQILGHVLLASISLLALSNGIKVGPGALSLDILLVVVVAGTMLFGPRGSITYALVAGGIYLIAAICDLTGFATSSPYGEGNQTLIVVTAVVKIVIMSVIVLLSRLIENSVQQAQRHSQQQADELQLANAALAQQSQELKRARDRLASVVIRQQEDLSEATEAQTELAAAVQALSTPVVPLIQGVIVLVLVGEIDKRRADQFTSSLLGGIERERAKVALIDITGVPTVDTQVAASLIQAASAARLLGAEVVIVGITPAVAQTLVGLGLNFGGLQTASDLQAGILIALRHRKLALVPAA